MNLLVTITLGAMLSLSKPVSVDPTPEASKSFTTITTAKEDMTYQQILDLSPKNFEALTGKQLSFKEKMGLNLLKRDIKAKIKSQEIAVTDKVNFKSAIAGEGTSVNILGFFAGLLLGLIGVLLVYLLSDDKVMRRSSWYGWGVWLIILLLLMSLA